MYGYQVLGLLLEVIVEEYNLIGGNRLNANDAAAKEWTFSEVAVLGHPLLLCLPFPGISYLIQATTIF